MKNFTHLSSLVFNTPLLCTPEYAETVCSVLGERVGIDLVGLPPIEAKGREKRSQSLSGSTMIIPILGSMSHRASGIEAMSGMTSYAALQAQVEDAMSDKSVTSILFDIDSPGGSVAGAFDFRDYLVDQRGRKPVYAISRDSMNSAAYLIGSTADKVYTTQTGAVGSIGVVAMHIDQSEKNAKDGIKPTFIHAGDYKVAGNPHEPLEGEALSYLQESVNDSYEKFIQAVANARDMDADAVRATQARVYRGEKAVAQGLADGVASFDVALNQLATSAPRVYQSSQIKTKETLMTPEEIEKMQADFAAVQASNEALRGYLIAEGYTISADGVSKETKEYITVGGEQVDKATLPASVVEALLAADAAAEDTALEATATSTLPNFALEDAKSLLKVAGEDEAMLTALKSADAALGSLMKEVGETNVENNMGTAQERLDALVEDHMNTNKLTGNVGRAKALAAVISTADGKALEAQARKEAK